jgi:hypothetical protein
MRLSAAALLALSAAVLLPAVQAAAQSRPVGRDYTVSHSKDEDGRRRTRIIVQRRSYLDPGTEVLQGERNYTDYALLPTHSASGILNGTAFGDRGTLPGPWDLPGKRNTWGW